LDGLHYTKEKKEGKLFLYFVMSGVFFAPFAKFLELYSSLNFFLVFSAPIVNAFAFTAGKFYKLVL
jgi:hypothetical protein